MKYFIRILKNNIIENFKYIMNFDYNFELNENCLLKKILYLLIKEIKMVIYIW